MKNFFSKNSQLSSRIKGEYDKKVKDINKCVFCDLKPKYVLCEKGGLVLTVNIFPYIDGQLLIIPKRHIENFNELTEKEVVTNFRLSKKSLEVLRKAVGVRGVWMILRDGKTNLDSGKTVKHLHWNIMPYNQKLNTWHYQKITILPIDLAAKLRKFFK